LFINAVHEVTRKNAQSLLDDLHIDKIAKTYHEYIDVEGFARVVNIEDTSNNAFSLSIPLYIRDESDISNVIDLSITECIELWNESRNDMIVSYEQLKNVLTELAGEDNA
jgi:type I restriction enzyme M protein